MNEREAASRGYRFTGIYGRRHEEVKARLEQVRRQGYKAVLVTEPDSPYSRGPIGTGWSVYAEQRYFIDADANRLMNQLSGIPKRRAHAAAEFRKSWQEIEADRIKMEQQLRELRRKQEG